MILDDIVARARQDLVALKAARPLAEVRERGAAPAERRLQAAVTAGIARRGYIRGMAAAKGCKIAPIAPEPAAKGGNK